MSKLIVKGHDSKRFELNVTQFRSSMSASINSVQTRKMMHHFPIRAGQPDIQFTVQFRSISDHHEFRDFARSHQRNALDDRYSSSDTSTGMIKLLWPERDINNWTGYIVNMPGRDARFEYAPRITFGVALVDSLLSERTFNLSLGNNYWAIVGDTLGAYIPDPRDVDGQFQLPSIPASLVGESIETAVNTVTSLFSTVTNPGR